MCSGAATHAPRHGVDRERLTTLRTIPFRSSSLLHPNVFPVGHQVRLHFSHPPWITQSQQCSVQFGMLDLGPHSNRSAEGLSYCYLPQLTEASRTKLFSRDAKIPHILRVSTRNPKRLNFLRGSFWERKDLLLYLFSFALIYVNRRYALQFVPVFMGWTAEGLLWCLAYLKKLISPRTFRSAAAVLTVIFFAGILPRML